MPSHSLFPENSGSPAKPGVFKFSPFGFERLKKHERYRRPQKKRQRVNLGS